MISICIRILKLSVLSVQLEIQSKHKFIIYEFLSDKRRNLRKTCNKKHAANKVVLLLSDFKSSLSLDNESRAPLNNP